MRHFCIITPGTVLSSFGVYFHSELSSFPHLQGYSDWRYFSSKQTLVTKTATIDELAEAKNLLIQRHGRSIMRALLSGFAAVAPRSATPNLIELLSTFTTRFPAESKAWMTEILYSVCSIFRDLRYHSRTHRGVPQENFTPSKATPEAKDRFLKTVMAYVSFCRIDFPSSWFHKCLLCNRSRSGKRIREAAQQFTLIARGLDGSSFGYATVTM